MKVYMEKHGFAFEETGGGCTAYTRRWPDGSESVITRVDDPVAPESLDEPVNYRLNDEKGDEIESVTWQSIDEYFYMLRRVCEG